MEKGCICKWSKPRIKLGPVHRRLFKETPTQAYTYSANWSGFFADTSSSRVIGEWQQPSITADASHRPSYACFWAGIGGHYSGDPLIQAGSNGNVDSNNIKHTDLWYEIVGSSADTQHQVLLTNLSEADAGDYIYTDIYVEDNSTAGLTAHFYIANITQNESTSFIVPYISGIGTSSDTAEWIAERTMVNNSLAANLTDWGVIHFRDCQYGSAGSTSFISSSDSNMENETLTSNGTSSGDILAFPGTIGGDADFNVTWADYN